MLRLYDEFGSPLQGGVLSRKTGTEAILSFPEGRQRSVVDADSNGYPESVEDTLSDGTSIFAYDYNQDGRPEALGREAPLRLLLRDAWSFRQFGDRDRNGTFDALEIQTSEGRNKLRVLHHVDAKEDGRFLVVESRLVTAVFR